LAGRNRRALFHLAPLAVVATAVGIAASETGGGDPRTRARDRLTGRVTTDGSLALRHLSRGVAGGFNRRHPNVRVTVGASGDSSAIDAFCAGELDVAAVARDLTPAERADCESAGVRRVHLEVAREGIAIVISETNPSIDCLTLDQIRSIWRAESPARSWTDLGGLPSEPLQPIGLRPDRPAHTLLAQALFGPEGRTRDDYEVAGDPFELAAAVASSPGAVGYLTLGQLRPGVRVRAVPVDAGTGCATPTQRTVLSRSYRPLSRPFNLEVNRASLRRPEVRRFLRDYSRAAPAISRAIGLVPLDSSPPLHRIFTRP